MLRTLFSEPITQTRLVLYVSLFLVLFDNIEFFRQTAAVYGLDGIALVYIASTAVVLFGVIFFVLRLFSTAWTIKPLLIVIVLISSVTSYFMNTYHIVIDEEMIRNTLQTDIAEAKDLMSLRFAAYFVLSGILPAYWIYRVSLARVSWRKALWEKLKALILSLLLIVATILPLGKFYGSFFREHKVLRYYTNPAFWIDSLGHYIYENYLYTPPEHISIGTDARIDDNTNKKLVIVIVGEAARADHFSLNGYARPTTPALQKRDIINYPHMYSCATSTAQSVPCMFSIYTRSDFNYQKAYYTDNVLDILKRTGKVAILWRDNNSDSKGVALRVTYENFKTPQRNPVCDEECRDIGMLSGLDGFVAQHRNEHILIVLHQMGNHGPAYYKRSPNKTKKFAPECRSNQLEQCDKETIRNAYDNALVYSDEFWAQTVAFAKRFRNRDVAVIYMSDHGESLGEHGIYLHGLPYFIAPEAQKHIGAFIWLNDRLRAKLPKIKTPNARYSHDYLFHTLLGLFEVRTSVYDPTLDLLHRSK